MTDARPGIVVTIHDLPSETELSRVHAALDAIKNLGAETDILVDMAGRGVALAQSLWTRGIGARALPKHPPDSNDLRVRLRNCHGLLARVENGLRSGTLAGSDTERKNLLFDLEALSGRC